MVNFIMIIKWWWIMFSETTFLYINLHLYMYNVYLKPLCIYYYTRAYLDPHPHPPYPSIKLSPPLFQLIPCPSP